VKNLIAGGGYDAIYFIAHHQGGKLNLHGRGPQGKLDLRELTVKDNPLIFLNACEAANIDSMAVRELLESGAGFVVATLNKVDALEAIRFGGLFFDALFGCSTYHDYLNSAERFGLQRPEHPLPVARALSWARRGFEQRNGTGWSYVLFGQPDPRKLEKLIQEAVEELRRHGLWNAVVKVRRCLRSEEEVREIVLKEIQESLAAGDWDTIKAMGKLLPPYWGTLRDKVRGWAEQKLAEREWQEVIDHKEVLGQLGLNAGERAEMAARADRSNVYIDRRGLSYVPMTG
jgi:hypothetical protein